MEKLELIFIIFEGIFILIEVVLNVLELKQGKEIKKKLGENNENNK